MNEQDFWFEFQLEWEIKLKVPIIFMKLSNIWE